jgi:hypothetical protein
MAEAAEAAKIDVQARRRLSGRSSVLNRQADRPEGKRKGESDVSDGGNGQDWAPNRDVRIAIGAELVAEDAHL